MKIIGIVDYFLDEWHANHFPAWLDKVCKEKGYEFKVGYAWGEKDNENGISNEEWCKKFSVEMCDSIESVCEKSDYIVILAPSNPEKHSGYAKKVFRYGKRTYIDKTFAPDSAEAAEIYREAQSYGVDFFSTSALRYADELSGLSGKAIITTGGGGSIEEYVVHQAEMVVSVIGEGAERVRTIKNGDHYFTEVKYGDERYASMVFGWLLPFAVQADKADGSIVYLPINSDYFINLTRTIADFFHTGIKPFGFSQTLEVMKIREAVIEGLKRPGKWIETKNYTVK